MRGTSTRLDKELKTRIRIAARSLVFQRAACHDVDAVHSIY